MPPANIVCSIRSLVRLLFLFIFWLLLLLLLLFVLLFFLLPKSLSGVFLFHFSDSTSGCVNRYNTGGRAIQSQKRESAMVEEHSTRESSLPFLATVSLCLITRNYS